MLYLLCPSCVWPDPTLGNFVVLLHPFLPPATLVTTLLLDAFLFILATNKIVMYYHHHWFQILHCFGEERSSGPKLPIPCKASLASVSYYKSVTFNGLLLNCYLVTSQGWNCFSLGDLLKYSSICTISNINSLLFPTCG